MVERPQLILSLCKVEMRSTVDDKLIIRRSLASTLHNDMLVIKEQFDIPALSVEFCDCQGFVSQMVGKEAIDIAGSEVFISDHSEVLGIALRWLDSCKFDNLIADGQLAL